MGALQHIATAHVAFIFLKRQSTNLTNLRMLPSILPSEFEAHILRGTKLEKIGIKRNKMQVTHVSIKRFVQIHNVHMMEKSPDIGSKPQDGRQRKCQWRRGS